VLTRPLERDVLQQQLGFYSALLRLSEFIFVGGSHGCICSLLRLQFAAYLPSLTAFTGILFLY